MLIQDFRAIGNNLLSIRSKAGLTQAEVAEMAELSPRTYADIERGTVNMRMKTLLQICVALRITPDTLFTQEEQQAHPREEELLARLERCSPKDKATALRLLEVYLDSLK